MEENEHVATPGREQRRRHRAGRLLVAAALLGWMGWAGWGAGARWVAAAWGPVDVARWGQLSEETPGTLWVVRQERLLRAPSAGRVLALVGEGEAVRRGQALLRVIPEGAQGGAATLWAPSAGIVSFVSDGLEAADAFSAPAPPRPPRDDSARPVSLVGGGVVARGQPVVRLVDHAELRGIFWPDRPSRWRPAEGQRVEVWVGAGGTGVPGSVTKAPAAPGGSLELRLERQPVEWLYRRLVPGVRLVTGRYTGVIVPSSALAARSGHTGVWVQTEGGPVFVPVQVVGRLGGRAVVQGVSDRVRVYRWPRWLGS
ncbi:hypothetical protein U7230_05020 [Carboxydochorda subterranea]|uniref:Uncharacterized protein n=1 Tax=Carboxydichorda subterranea TaxID=3109565 RepID=A0ABZ1C2J1_9FIRM|nr:hypothetical protein [Limnochorda sp. L945t]WRP18373.1 hypothetical protein U7230_05020 [Limnochorda sp. L945t]